MTKILVVGLAVILAAAGSGRADSTTGQSGTLGNERKAGFHRRRTFIWERAFVWERRCAAGAVAPARSSGSGVVRPGAIAPSNRSGMSR